MVKKKARKRRQALRSSKAEQWKAQAGWLIDIITKLDQSPAAHGHKWTYKMILHYAKQFEDHCKDTPRSCSNLRLSHRHRIQALVDKYKALVEV